MSFENGDRVKVTTKNSQYTGKEGTIINAYGDQESLLVKMDDRGNDVGFFVSEVERIVSREDEIRKLADVLYASDRWMGLPWVQVLETAEDLYDAGIRYHG